MKPIRRELKMKILKNFAAFILTHGRANQVLTYSALRKAGYTGKIYLVVDSEDSELELYKENYGDEVLIFDKSDYVGKFDMGDNFKELRSVIYARHACYDLAVKVGIKYLIQLDDDYSLFRYKFDNELKYGDFPIRNLNKIFGFVLNYYIKTGIKTIAFSQGGDFLGENDGTLSMKVYMLRKAMNTYITSVDNRLEFKGTMNSDATIYVNEGRTGSIFFTTNFISINQKQTQSLSGGITQVYQEKGTYIKSFYTVMYNPSSVIISCMGQVYRRLHHRVLWKQAVPMIIREEHKKQIS
jgi:hypothetical protein